MSGDAQIFLQDPLAKLAVEKNTPIGIDSTLVHLKALRVDGGGQRENPIPTKNRLKAIDLLARRGFT
jgi:hypothetical protein